MAIILHTRQFIEACIESQFSSLHLYTYITKTSYIPYICKIVCNKLYKCIFNFDTIMKCRNYKTGCSIRASFRKAGALAPLDFKQKFKLKSHS